MYPRKVSYSPFVVICVSYPPKEGLGLGNP
jgi:hypothetical protein